MMNPYTLTSLKKHHKRVLITVDEAVSTPAMKAFTSAFQIFENFVLENYIA